jgi:hypothetical protein
VPLVIGAGLAIAYSDRPPARRTGAPGESTCNGCHSGALNDGLGVLTITGAPASYLPNQKYSVTVTLTRGGQSRWGFELTVLRKADNIMSGTLTATSPLTTTQVALGKTYVSHTTLFGQDGTHAGTANGPVSWTFDWTAPAAGADTVVFYAAGVAANNNGDADPGDLVYTTRAMSAEDRSTPAAASTWGGLKRRYR